MKPRLLLRARSGKTLRARPGATLPEIALALAVVGLLGAAGFAAATGLRATNAQRATTLALDRTEAALARAALTDGALPCPDSRNAPDGHPDRDWCDRVGLPPWRALGLARRDVVDGWDNLLSYAISPNLAPLAWGGTAPAPGHAPLECTDTARSLTRAEGLLPIIPGEDRVQLPSSGAAFALISHGPNGKGAIRADGRPAAAALTTATRAERETLAGQGRNRRIWSRPALDSEPARGAATDDDRVRWRPPGLLLLSAGCRMHGPGG